MKKSNAYLYIFSGLPGTGKSTLAKALSRNLNAAYFRIDTLEQGLKDICRMPHVEGEGYRLSYQLIKDNLRLGISAVADSVNPWKLTRDEWSQVASSCGAPFINIEIVCSDQNEHRQRVESRRSEIKNLKMPSWEEVLNRDYHEWDSPRIEIDTAAKSEESCLLELQEAIRHQIASKE